mgnify:CR=1 FL=1
MIELGKKQKLTVVKSVDFGIYLGEDMHRTVFFFRPDRFRKEQKKATALKHLSTRILRIVLLQQQKNRSFR